MPEKISPSMLIGSVDFLIMRGSTNCQLQNIRSQQFRHRIRHSMQFCSFSDVLGKETGDLSSTVRAQRGQKLPVVFSVEEVKGLFAHMTGKSLLIAELRKYVHSQSAFCL